MLGMGSREVGLIEEGTPLCSTIHFKFIMSVESFGMEQRCAWTVRVEAAKKGPKSPVFNLFISAHSFNAPYQLLFLIMYTQEF